MLSVLRLSLRPGEHGKVTPFEVLRDFADVKTGWSYLEEDSRHYADLKDAPGLILRHRLAPSAYADLGFVGSSSAPSALDLAVLDRPDAETPLSADEREALLDAFLDAMRDYLSTRPDHVTLHVERDTADPSSS
jgi:hypothetical protein